jgi:hypothetical protein
MAQTTESNMYIISFKLEIKKLDRFVRNVRLTDDNLYLIKVQQIN